MVGLGTLRKKQELEELSPCRRASALLPKDNHNNPRFPVGTPLAPANDWAAGWKDAYAEVIA